MSKAYAVSDRLGKTPIESRQKKNWFIMRCALGLVGEVPEGSPIPKRCIKQFVPMFTLIAQDREAAMKEIACKVGELFDAWENQKALDEAAGGKRKRS